MNNTVSRDIEANETNSVSFDLNRREVIAGGLTALIVPILLGGSTSKAIAAGGSALGPYIKIDGSNNVTVVVGSSEMGQGISSGIAQLVAEELKLNWNQVLFEHAGGIAAQYPTNPYANPLFFWQFTGGSSSMRAFYSAVRTAAAQARDKLEQAYPNGKIGVGGFITDTNGNLPKSFSSLVSAASGKTSAINYADSGTRHIIGTSVKRLDVVPKSNGSAIFGMDMHSGVNASSTRVQGDVTKLSGMVYATVIHSPVAGGTVSGTLPTLSGVTLVNLGNAVGVVSAKDTYQAMKAANTVASQIRWANPDSATIAKMNTSAIAAQAQTLQDQESPQHTWHQSGTLGALSFNQTYTLPMLAHACMEVMNCTAAVTLSGGSISNGIVTGATVTACEVWAPTQTQGTLAFAIMGATELSDLSKIKVNVTYIGGGFGRKLEDDYVVQAVKISKAVGKPVKLIWSRKQDMQNDFYRPYVSIRVKAGLDGSNKLSSLRYRNVSTDPGVQKGYGVGLPTAENPEASGPVAGAFPFPYKVPNQKIEFSNIADIGNIKLGWWRSVGESYNVFAVESAIDELSIGAGIDPIQFRLNHLTDVGSLHPDYEIRAQAVLEEVKTMTGWGTTTLPAQTSRGVAFMKGWDSYIALVLEITLNGLGQIWVKKAFAAVDCGLVINPDSVKAQIQSGIAQGLSSALWGQVIFTNGTPNVVNFSNYRVLTASEMPEVTINLIGSQAINTLPGGIGELGVPCVAPALANAYARMSGGTRVRNLPFYPGATMDD